MAAVLDSTEQNISILVESLLCSPAVGDTTVHSLTLSTFPWYRFQWRRGVKMISMRVLEGGE